MGTKNNPGEFDCYAAAHPDEPLFVLRGNHDLSPKVVRQWAALYATTKLHENALLGEKRRLTPRQQRKYDEAMECADAMEAWQRKQWAAALDA